ncbi:MAG: methylenetetrahydrofolate--tRNA-(uracil(54)-C(5))-methyltransferase (FADH(2)-oxidizing) TrmFO [Ruminococcus sp.]|nr:methylenetetrahydrofolate--tRNA-(uracil(54)-C(5))-methyltransferase (FADH(2)-oxidizing) TrmFO [Ruminococcus sp.]MDY3894911.1 methylenetetrahydrofolate--tRNA-(uracil(54)-C(5))-methyltransferase (FADH(2)-oxidizing) TrmFO [Candidatus Fimenecus sp.]
MKAAVIGAGLAGCEAAKQLSRAGIPTYLYEMKPKKFSPAHKSENFAELVCSNSLKAERLNSAAGLLKAEMERLSSVCVAAAKKTRVPAGGALSVDRDEFSALITENIKSDKNITVINEEVSVLPDADVTVVAAGPLASDALTGTIHALCGDGLSFYDAAAPIVSADSVDMEFAFTQSRYDRGGSDDYINCPMNKEQYEAFYEAIINAESAEMHSFDKRHDVYEGCMPIEVLASRGKDTMRFGPLKPVGLRDPRTGHRPWANLQLRRENSDGTMYNLVGFQTNLKFGEQKRVFSMFPALHNAEFLRYGVMHRNTFINSPRLLNASYSLRSDAKIFFAGQITGVEGYMESASSGIMAGLNAARFLSGKEPLVLPRTTVIGALARYISDETVTNFQPMGANFGILPPLPEKIRDKSERYTAIAERGMKDLEEYLKSLGL